MDATLYIDGGARGNPGPAAAGIVIQQTDSGQTLLEAGYFLGHTTNNVAEYQALIRGLQLADRLGATTVHIHSDSQLIVRQIRGQYRVKSPDLKPLFDQVHTLLTNLHWHLDHIPRNLNRRADELANQAMDAQRDLIPNSPQDPAVDQSPPAASSPSLAFTAEIRGKTGRCLAGCASGNAYTFGPTTPEGFCLYAAAAALTDGPLQWNHPKRDGQTLCPRCRATIRLQRLT